MEKEIERPAKLTIILGTNGTGKSTLLRTIIQRNAQRTLIVTPDAAEWTDYQENMLQTKQDFLFAGIQRHIFNPTTTLNSISKFVKGNLVLDDYRAFMLAQTNPIIHNLAIRRRQKELDIFVAAHGFTEVPPMLFTFASDIFLFRTTENVARRKDCLKDFETIKKLQETVNKAAQKNPHFYKYYKFS
ncbi:MAG: ATP-binding protein [Bacteroidales bacterium]|nr:ATP-binding protein [Bacteroidales bacterium]MCQ2605445.1 ATP-binding protein [Bacteroidales bacterium]